MSDEYVDLPKIVWKEAELRLGRIPIDNTGIQVGSHPRGDHLVANGEQNFKTLCRNFIPLGWECLSLEQIKQDLETTAFYASRLANRIEEALEDPSKTEWALTVVPNEYDIEYEDEDEDELKDLEWRYQLEFRDRELQPDLSEEAMWEDTQKGVSVPLRKIKTEDLFVLLGRMVKHPFASEKEGSDGKNLWNEWRDALEKEYKSRT